MSKARMLGAFAPIQRPRQDRRWQQKQCLGPKFGPKQKVENVKDKT